MEQKQENTLDICLLLGKLDGKMDQLIREQTRFESLIAKSQERIDKLEKDRAIVYGAAAVLAFIGSGVMGGLSLVIKGS